MNNLNKVITKDARKSQKKALKEALNKEKSQGSALRTLKRLNKQYDCFNLSKFQAFILDNQDECFKAVQSTYTPTMLKKVEQLERLKNDKKPLTKVRYIIEYENNGLKFKAKGTFATKKEANEQAENLTVSNIDIVKQEREIPTTFTPNEMLSRLQFMERKFYKCFENPKTFTLPMILRSLNEDVTDKDKATVKNGVKKKIKKAS